jgi:hypothetical protein
MGSQLRPPNGPTLLFVALDHEDQEIKLNRIVAAIGSIPKVLDFSPEQRGAHLAGRGLLKTLTILASFCQNRDLQS